MKMLMTVKWDEKDPPTLETIAAKMDVGIADLDAAYGVINIDPQEKLYSVMVEEDKLPELKNKTDIQGPYSNPKIEPFDLQ